MANDTDSNDEIVTRYILGKPLFMRKSHRLPDFFNSNKLYDSALPRICKNIKKTDGYLSLIDIGANIGDTLSLVLRDTIGDYLCIEGDSDFFKILQMNAKNISKDNNIELINEFCSDVDELSQSYKFINGGGNGMLVMNNSEDFTPIKLRKLNTIIKEHPKFKRANILKSDTEGFEIEVINGASTFIRKQKPYLFIEYSPKLYVEKGYTPYSLLELLLELDYKIGLAYSNLGLPVKVVDVSDKKSTEELISLVDFDKIHYYDILFIPSSKKLIGRKLIDNELLSIINLISTNS